MQDEYYSRSEISNSDLSALKRALYPPLDGYEAPVEAYKFGRLIDYMLTEPDKIDSLNLMAGGEQYTQADFALAEAMRRSFLKDDLCRLLKSQCTGQTVMSTLLNIQHKGLDFALNVRCKYDFWGEGLKYGGDLKSTTAESQRQFEQAAEYFDYDRQRAWYMDISGAEKDILIGVSKKAPHKVFKIFIDRNSTFYKNGKRKYQDLAFRWFCLFGNSKPEHL